MNQNYDKEMELLLRRHAQRRKAAGVSAERSQAVPDASSSTQRHLDADELSAFAEGALPERARSRYVAHLADCDECRKILTELALTNASQTEEVVAPAVQTGSEPTPSWRRWLGALFSPAALRFAAPALALIAFAAIMVVIVTRNRDVTNFVAQNEQSKQQPANSGAAPSKDSQANTTSTANANDENHSAPVAGNANAIEGNRGAGQAGEQDRQPSEPPAAPQQPEGAPPAGSAPSPEVAQRELPNLKDQERVAEEKNAPKPLPGNAPADKSEKQEKEKDDYALSAKKRTDADEVAAAPPAATTTNSAATGGRAARGAEVTGGATYGGGDAPARDTRQRNEAAKTAASRRAQSETSSRDESEDSKQTRVVAGKRFQLRNGVWVDTAYISSRGTVRVKRGSEQYRALVADEPIIGSISNELGGSFIVVVKGRAYQIY